MARILIVDDEEHIRRLYSEVLSRDGHQVETASNGNEALEYVQNNPVDVVVLDIEMEGESGLETLKALKAANSDIPVILNTAYTIYMSDFKTWMAEDYIVKSSDIQPLRDKINRMVKYEKEKS